MSFSTELLFILVLALLVLGPKRLHTILGYLARTKAEFKEATSSLRSQLTADLKGEHQIGEPGSSDEVGGDN